MPEYQIIRHPRTGEGYACETDGPTILRAFGPLRLIERAWVLEGICANDTIRDGAGVEAIRDLLDNQFDDESVRADAEWLTAELER